MPTMLEHRDARVSLRELEIKPQRVAYVCLRRPRHDLVLDSELSRCSQERSQCTL